MGGQCRFCFRILRGVWILSLPESFWSRCAAARCAGTGRVGWRSGRCAGFQWDRIHLLANKWHRAEFGFGKGTWWTARGGFRRCRAGLAFLKDLAVSHWTIQVPCCANEEVTPCVIIPLLISVSCLAENLPPTLLQRALRCPREAPFSHGKPLSPTAALLSAGLRRGCDGTKGLSAGVRRGCDVTGLCWPTAL